MTYSQATIAFEPRDEVTIRFGAHAMESLQLSLVSLHPSRISLTIAGKSPRGVNSIREVSTAWPMPMVSNRARRVPPLHASPIGRCLAKSGRFAQHIAAANIPLQASLLCTAEDDRQASASAYSFRVLVGRLLNLHRFECGVLPARLDGTPISVRPPPRALAGTAGRERFSA